MQKPFPESTLPRLPSQTPGEPASLPFSSDRGELWVGAAPARRPPPSTATLQSRQARSQTGRGVTGLHAHSAPACPDQTATQSKPRLRRPRPAFPAPTLAVLPAGPNPRRPALLSARPASVNCGVQRRPLPASAELGPEAARTAPRPCVPASSLSAPGCAACSLSMSGVTVICGS